MALAEKTGGLVDRIEKNSLRRQRECVNLIPSESSPSLLVKMCELADPAGRYAEHRTMKGEEVYFYQGIDFIKDVEIEARRELSAYFGCADVELRPVSGQMANEIVFKGVTKFLNRGRAEGQPSRRMRLVMNNDLGKGGHLSSQPMGALYNWIEEDPVTGKENVVNFPVRKDMPYKIDREALAALLETKKPELVVFGKSMFLHPEPVAFVAGIVKDWPKRPILMYDMAHVLGLYGAFQEPFQEGADIVTGSTHKTFFGPQRGLVAGNITASSPLKNLWADIRSRAFPGSTSNHHLATLLGLLMATYEMNAFKKEFQTAVRANAKSFAASLHSHGIPVEGDPADGFTDTHQVIIRVSAFGPGMEIARRLEDNNIVTNYQALPDDETFLVSSGIRMGVQEMTRFGLTGKDFDVVAGLIADCIIRKAPVQGAVKAFRRDFLEMKYCLPAAEAVPLAARIFAAALPTAALGEAFAAALAPNRRI
jgi:glycine/serine hydroxymethyltransferase